MGDDAQAGRRGAEPVIHPNQLTIHLSEFEQSPRPRRTYVTLDVEAKAGAFSGSSACVLAARDLEAFLDALEALGERGDEEALLVGGWGATENVRLRVGLRDRLGHLEIRVVLREEPVGDGWPAHRVELHFDSEIQPLRRLADRLRRGARRQETGSFPVFVEGGPSV